MGSVERTAISLYTSAGMGAVQGNMREIWGIGTPRSFRPIWVCEELGLDYQHHAIGPRTGETQQPEFTALNRKQKIPFYRDERVSLSESLAICRYLAHNFSAGPVSYTHLSLPTILLV